MSPKVEKKKKLYHSGNYENLGTIALEVIQFNCLLFQDVNKVSVVEFQLFNKSEINYLEELNDSPNITLKIWSSIVYLQ